MTQKEWTAEELYDDNLLYCVYCFGRVNNRLSCCGENHFMTGQELLEREKELDEIDRRRQGASE